MHESLRIPAREDLRLPLFTDLLFFLVKKVDGGGVYVPRFGLLSVVPPGIGLELAVLNMPAGTAGSDCLRFMLSAKFELDFFLLW